MLFFLVAVAFLGAGFLALVEVFAQATPPSGVTKLAPKLRQTAISK